MKKIITFISPIISKTIELQNGEKKKTFDPEKPIRFIGSGANKNIVVYGNQTNEAPIKYLLKKDSEIGEVICVCSNLSKKLIPNLV